MIQRIPSQAIGVGSNPRVGVFRHDVGPPGLRTSGPSITVIQAMLFAADIMSTLTYGASDGVRVAVPCWSKWLMAQRPNHTASVI
jgi:hypothetical protein